MPLFSFHERAVPVRVLAGELTAASLASLLAKGSLLCRCPSVDIFLSGAGVRSAFTFCCGCMQNVGS